MSISSTLKNWYLQKKRILPWRISRNPYHIWISEVILQQTRVAQGIDYFNRFIARFPDIHQLAYADTEEILKLWQGLGYYSRARNLHAGAKYVVQQFNGILPSNYDELLKINGVGEYTAAAIASIAFDLPCPVIDGNVNRVIARLFGVHDPINTNDGIKRIKEFAISIFDAQDPGTHNQALMEFGALQCVIKNPLCNECPFQINCYAYLHDEVNLLPIKLRASKPRIRYFNYLVIFFNDELFIHKRIDKDIWEGLYEFPLCETDSKVNQQELTCHPEWKLLFSERVADVNPLNIIEAKRHLLTHQTIHATYYIIYMKPPLVFSSKYQKIHRDEIHQYPVSKLIDNFIKSQFSKP